jgi:hypothetical protein
VKFVKEFQNKREGETLSFVVHAVDGVEERAVASTGDVSRKDEGRGSGSGVVVAGELGHKGRGAGKCARGNGDALVNVPEANRRRVLELTLKIPVLAAIFAHVAPHVIAIVAAIRKSRARVSSRLAAFFRGRITAFPARNTTSGDGGGKQRRLAEVMGKKKRATGRRTGQGVCPVSGKGGWRRRVRGHERGSQVQLGGLGQGNLGKRKHMFRGPP